MRNLIVILLPSAIAFGILGPFVRCARAQTGAVSFVKPCADPAVEYGRAPAAPPEDEAAGLEAQIRQLLRTDKPAEALIAAKRLLAVRKQSKGEQSLAYADALDRLARVYTSLENWNEAEAAYREAIQIHKLSKETNADYALLLSQLADMFKDKGDYLKAEAAYKETLERSAVEDGKDSDLYSDFLNDLADLYITQKLFERAEPLYKQALQIRSRDKHDSAYGDALSHMGALYKNWGRFVEAEPYLRQALEVFQETDKNGYGHLNSLNALAELYVTLQQYPQAVSLYEQALRIREMQAGKKSVGYSVALDRLANVYKSLSRFTEAEVLLNEDLENRKARDGSNSATYAQGLQNLAALFGEIGRFSQAEILYGQALQIRRGLPEKDDLSLAFCLKALADLYGKMDRLVQAETLYRQILPVFERQTSPNVRSAFPICLNDLAEIYRKLGQNERALPLLDRAQVEYERIYGKDGPVLATPLLDAGFRYLRIGQQRRGEETIQRALAILHNAFGESPAYASWLNGVAFQYQSIGQLTRAESLLQTALSFYQKSNDQDRAGYAQCLRTLCLLSMDVGNYDRLEKTLQELEKLDPESSDLESQSAVFNRAFLAIFNFCVGRREKSIEQLQQVSDRIEKTPGTKSLVYAFVLLLRVALTDSATQTAAGRVEANQMLDQAAHIMKDVQGDRSAAYGAALTFHAIWKYGHDDAAGAIPLLQQTAEINRNINGENSLEYFNVLGALAEMEHTVGHDAEARPLLERVVAKLHSAHAEGTAGFLTTLNTLSLVYAATQQVSRAADTLQQAMQAQQTTMEQVFSFSSESDMRAYLDTTSSQHLLTALLLQRFAGNPDRVRQALTWTLRRKGVILDTLARFRRSRRVIEQNQEAAVQAAKLNGLRQAAISLGLHTPGDWTPEQQQAQIRSYLRESDTLEEQLNRLISVRQPSLHDAVTVEAVRKRLPSGTALVEFVRYLDYNFDSADAPLARRFKGNRYGAFILLPGLNIPPRYIALQDANTIEAAIQAVRRDLDAGDRRAAPVGPPVDEKNYRAHSAALYQKIFAPLKAALGSATTIYLSPDGELNQIPFEALIDGKGQYLIETYRFAYLSSGRDLLRQRAPVQSNSIALLPGSQRTNFQRTTLQEQAEPQGNGVFIFAHPNYDLSVAERNQKAGELLKKLPGAQAALQGPRSRESTGAPWLPLQGTQQEGEQVRHSLQGGPYGPVTLYTGDEALEEVFKALNSPRILHVATHGFFFPRQPEAAPSLPIGSIPSLPLLNPGLLQRVRQAENPLLRSGIVLAGANVAVEDREPTSGAAREDDGLVTAEEIALMNLHGTELVVLSACETGLGDVQIGEGVYGLRRAFLLAGAHTLITSLFGVPDRETAQLMNDFYSALKTRRLGKLEALSNAQRNILKARRAAHLSTHPFYWAGFILVGDPN